MGKRVSEIVTMTNELKELEARNAFYKEHDTLSASVTCGTIGKHGARCYNVGKHTAQRHAGFTLNGNLAQWGSHRA